MFSYAYKDTSRPTWRAAGTEALAIDFVTTGLVGWWPLDEGTGTAAIDYSDTGSDGTITSGTWVAGPGRSGVALRLAGSPARVVLGDEAAWEFGTDPFTACLWVKDLGALNGRLFGQQLAATDAGWIWIQGGGSVQYACLARIVNTGRTDALSGAWTHVAMVRNGATFGMYHNGVLKGTANAGNATGGSDLRICAGSTDGTNLIAYAQAEVFGARLYNRALSTDELNRLVIHGI